ncbi:MAG: hypothetical protein K0R46_1477 [Herbinix sp.]|jgi:DUF4097 and DUF4098 domain-containing protein YvlB|nr:hypothetical protein [Herbinix sp.]
MRTKQSKMLAVVLLLILSSALMTGCGVNYVLNATNQLDRDDASEFNIEKTEVEPITDINIHTGIAEVELVEADKFYVEIDYLYWEEEPEYSLENGTLIFDDSDCFPTSYSINFNLDNHIKVYLPKNSQMSSINIKDSSGDVNIQGFIAEELDVTVSYGDFTMKEAAALDAEIVLSSGTSKITDFQAKELDFTNSYGNADFTNINTTDLRLSEDTTYDKFNVTMSSGDVTIRGLVSNTIDISDSYGNITMDGLTSDELELNLSSGNCEITNGDIISSDISNSYGDVTLAMLGSSADYALDLDTSYGKIRVDGDRFEEHLTTNEGAARRIMTELSSGDVTVEFTK